MLVLMAVDSDATSMQERPARRCAVVNTLADGVHARGVLDL
jgi:hypothetical protein